MKLIPFESMPYKMQTQEVKKYYERLKKKTLYLSLKRAFDIVASSSLIILLALPMIIIAFKIKIDSRGPVIFKQTRITQFGRKFTIYKFRTMVNDAPKKGSAVTVGGDSRVTKVGGILRKYRLDEFPQLFNILAGDMTFVGTRPEVVKYVNAYSKEMYATLLLPAGVTSRVSIMYKDEERLLDGCDNPDEIYIKEILPEKMKYNLIGIAKASVLEDLYVMIRTVLAVLKR